MWMYSLMIFMDSRLTMNIKTLGYMNGTKTFHRWLICHGWIMDLGWNLVTILNIFKNGHAKWPTCNWKMEKLCNGGDLLRMIRSGYMVYFESYEWYKNFKDGELKGEALNCKAILEESMDMEEESSNNAMAHCSPSDEWEDFEHATNLGADANSNPYLDVSRIFNDHAGTKNHNKTQENKGWFDEHKLMEDDDDDISDLEDCLIQNDPPYVNEDEEISKERRCKLLGIPYVKPPTCKSEKFEVVKYSFGPEEECVAI
ncbi:hypothetical protein Tco_1475309 [Tanacetum coccineum]